MIAITAASHEQMLTVAGPHAPVTQVAPGAFAVPSYTVNVSYVVRVARTQNNSLMECSCSDHTMRRRLCKHCVAIYVHLADKAMEMATAA